MRLYRCESFSGRGRRPDPEPGSWIWQGAVESGLWDAMGRWFVEDAAILPWYARDAGAFRIVSIDVDPDEAELWRVSRNPSAGRFSRDPDNEFFVPRAVAEAAQPDEAMTLEVAGMLSAEDAACSRP